MKLTCLTVSISVLALTSCNQKMPSPPSKVEVRAATTLAPEDLGIRKYNIVASPAKDEVVVLRVRRFKAGKVEQTHDQIYYLSGAKVEKSVCLIRKSFFVDYPKNPSNPLAEHWRLIVDRYRADIDDKEEAGGGFGGSEAYFRFTGNTADAGADLAYQVSALVMKYADAKRLHPDLPPLREGSDWEGTYPNFAEPPPVTTVVGQQAQD